MEDFQSKYNGPQVEEMLDRIASGEAGGGGGGITVETDPVFSASPAASITEAKKTEWDNKVDKVSGKQLSTEDFTTALKTKLEGLFNYDDAELSEAIATLRQDFDELVSGDTTTAIKTFNEVIAFLDGIKDTQDLSSIIASIEQQIAGKMDKVTLATVATSGSYDDLSDKPTIPSAVTESTVSGWGFTKNTGTYSKPSGGIPASDLASDVFLQGEKGDKGDQGEQGEQGPQGPEGPKGDDGVGIASVVQTTTSSADGGNNVMTVTLSNGTKSTFTVKNGSKGIQGPKGDKGDKGDTGAAGTNGTNGKDGADGEDGATFTPSVDANGNLSWTNNKGLSNPPTVNIKGPKGDSGEGGGSSGGGGVAYKREFIGIERSSDITLLPNKLYYIESIAGGGVDINVGIFFDEDIDDTICNEYNFIINIDVYFTISLPDDIIWANGEAPQFESFKAYHISIVEHYAVFAEFNEIW